MSTALDITSDYLRSLSFRPLHAGDDYHYKFTIEQGGEGIDLSDAKVWFTIKETSLKTDEEAKLQYTSEDSDEIEITEPLSGKIVVKFAGGDTEDLEGQWRYDLQIKATIEGIMKVVTVAWGMIEFLPNLTRATT